MGVGLALVALAISLVTRPWPPPSKTARGIEAGPAARAPLPSRSLAAGASELAPPTPGQRAARAEQGPPASPRSERDRAAPGADLPAEGAQTAAPGEEPISGALRGRAVDTAGQPLVGRVIVLGGNTRPGNEDWLTGKLADDGSFRFERVAPGVRGLLLGSDSRPLVRGEVEVRAGQWSEYDFVLDPIASVGSIAGRVRTPGDRPSFAHFVYLQSVDVPGYQRLVFGGGQFTEPDDPDGAAYRFEELPPGTYRLWVEGLDGRSYAPAEHLVEAPAAGVDFETRELHGTPTARMRLEVVDAVTAKPVEGVALLPRLGSLWVLEYELLSGGSRETSAHPREVELTMLLGAPGYLPRVVSTTEAVPDGEGGLLLLVKLERGHGAGLLVLDTERSAGVGNDSFADALLARGVTGARVLVDGRVCGETREDGVTLVSASAPIESYRVEAPGWVTVAVHRFRNHAHTPDGLGYVLMARAPR